MTNKNEVYKCDICGNIVEVLERGNGILVCCGQDMILFKENTVDAAYEKHLPVIEPKDEKILVSVGSVNHPMTEEHYIKWIEIITDDQQIKTTLKPGRAPTVTFNIKPNKNITARAFCNLHGLWRSEQNLEK